MAYHIWLKVNEVTIDTNFVNIYDTIDAFEGLSFAEIVLQSTNEENQRVFSHLNRAWSNYPSKECWAISVKTQMYDEAIRVHNNIRDDLTDIYGAAINHFFRDVNNGWLNAVKSSVTPHDDEDDWFEDDDDIDDVVKKGLVDSTFLRFFGGESDDKDKSSVASWGTGNTTYTEIVATKENSSTGISSITQESNVISPDEMEKKRDIVRVRLKMRDVSDDEIKQIISKQSPYELTFSGIHLPSWEPDKEVFMIMAIREQFKLNTLPK